MFTQEIKDLYDTLPKDELDLASQLNWKLKAQEYAPFGGTMTSSEKWAIENQLKQLVKQIGIPSNLQVKIFELHDAVNMAQAMRQGGAI